jgi:hypothetical protein
MVLHAYMHIIDRGEESATLNRGPLKHGVTVVNLCTVHSLKK